MDFAGAMGAGGPSGAPGHDTIMPTSAADLSAPALGQLPGGEWAQGA